MPQSLDFTAVDDAEPGSAAWTARIRPEWDLVLPGFDESTMTAEGQAAAVAAFGEHLPELLPVLERLAEAIDRPEAAAVLTQTTLKPFFAACTQTSVAGALVRNYDFDPAFCERVVSRTDYLRPVIGMSELFWGLLDGMNDAGLAVSLTLGGRRVHKPGMSILMIVRYLLATCDDVEQAWQRLQRIPVATAQNLTLVDREQAVSVHIGPDIRPTRAASVCVANHQTMPTRSSRSCAPCCARRCTTPITTPASARSTPPPTAPPKAASSTSGPVKMKPAGTSPSPTSSPVPASSRSAMPADAAW